MRLGLVARDRWQATGAALVTALLLAAAPAAAQEVAVPVTPPPPPRPTWKRTVELAGSLFLGNKSQGVLTTRLKAAHSDSIFEFGGDMRFTYGAATDDGERYVSQRSWMGSLNLDLWPHAGQSPFLLATLESSLERRIDLRASGGVGHKMSFIDDGESLADLSIAILGERSWLPTREDGDEIISLARFSGRLKLRRRLGSRVELSGETYFRPEVYHMTRFTFTNSASASFRMNELVNLKASYLDNYDSVARLRGARSNYDGQVVLGVQADF
ncbi:MAG: DUF481 domain-containing protein [Gemmatimonadaceae bacterium]